MTLRAKIFLSFLIFGGIMLALLWIFQVQFLDEFYRTIKAKAVKAAATDISSVLLKDDYRQRIDEIASENELCVSILNEDYIEIYTSNRRDPRCMIDKMKQSEIISLHEEAIANGGSASRLITTDEKHNPMGEKMWQGIFQDGMVIAVSGRANQNMTYAEVLKLSQNQSVIVLVNAEISPVNATVETIRTQLMIISFLLLGLGLFLAYVMARKIASPIIKINDSAKQLAKGNYDVTFSGSEYREIRELNDTLTYAASELSKVQNLQQELIANMSHDLRTPLTMISGYGEVMRDIPGENNAENVQVIIDEAKRLTSLVNDILDLSKLQAGVQSLALKECNITELVETLIRRYQKMVEAQEYHILFEHEESCKVKGDEIKLNQVMYNLINNAITYCGEDRTVIIRQINQEHTVRLEIIDHGAGIPEEELPYVWERYYKSKHHIRSAVGSGLGLSIVKNIVELHHGIYGVESELEQGTTFWIELPKA